MARRLDGPTLALAITAAAIAMAPLTPVDAASLGVNTFSQRVVLDLALRRAQVRALQKCAAAGPAAQQQQAPPPVDWRRLPLSPPTGTGGPVPQGPNPCNP
ncbi:MAG: hypothetical protein M0006_06570 [Magnetospirillum sp.]|nr:hypothetical protein [Magnetospirillum sp.]